MWQHEDIHEDKGFHQGWGARGLDIKIPFFFKEFVKNSSMGCRVIKCDKVVSWDKIMETRMDRIVSKGALNHVFFIYNQ